MNDSQVDGNALVITGASSLDNGLITTDGNGNINLPGSLTVSAFFGSSIQTALNQLGSNSGTITLPSGDYIVTSTISKSLAANQHIIIEGKGRARLVSTVAEPGSENGILSFTGDSGATARITIRNIHISHTNSGAGNLDGIYIQPLGYPSSGTQSLANLELDNVRITGASFQGTKLLGVLGGVALNCLMNSNRDSGMMLIGCQDFVVLGGDYSSNVTGALTGDYGIALGSSTLLPYSKNILILGAQTNNNGRKGIDVHHGHDIRLLGNTCLGNGGFGIYAVAESTSKDVQDITIIGNTIDMAGGNATLSQLAIQVGASGATGSITPGTFLIEGNTIRNVTANASLNAAFYVSTPTSGGGPDKVSIIGNTVENGAGATSGYIIKTENNSAIANFSCTGNTFHATSATVLAWIQKCTDFVVSNNIWKVDGGPPSNCLLMDSTASGIASNNDIEGTISSTVLSVGAAGFLRGNILNGAAMADSALVLPFTVTGGLTLDANGHLLSLSSGTPTLTAVNANVTNTSVSGNDVRGVINFDTQTGTISAGVALFTFNLANVPGGTTMMLVGNASNATNGEWHVQKSGNTFVVYGSSSVSVATGYKISYLVIA